MDNDQITQMLNETMASMRTGTKAPSAETNASTPSSTSPANVPVTTTAPATAIADEEEEYSDDGFDSQHLKYSCNQLRSQIRKFLGTKEITLSAFLKECKVNPGSYYRFMSLKGADNGCANNIYYGASLFFYRRERRAKLDKKKQNASDKKRKATEQREGKAKKAKAGADLLQRIQEVTLEDEGEDGYPPVYDDCDDIRKKITVFLGEKLVTQTAFLKALGNVSASSLRSFMNMKRGPGMGAANVVYRKGYVFFEKKRILEEGKKTKKRLDNEAKQGPNGFELRHDDGKRYYLVSELFGED